MATEEFDYVIEALQNDGSSVNYYLRLKDSSYSITAPSGHMQSYKGTDINIDIIKGKIAKDFNSFFTKIIPKQPDTD